MRLILFSETSVRDLKAPQNALMGASVVVNRVNPRKEMFWKLAKGGYRRSRRRTRALLALEGTCTDPPPPSPLTPF